MNKFKPGDIVIRTVKDHWAGGMEVGSKWVVISDTPKGIRVKSFLTGIEYRCFCTKIRFELATPKLPDWVKIEPEQIIPAKTVLDGEIILSCNDHPPLTVTKNNDTADRRTRLVSNGRCLGYFTKKGIQEWIKALQELESYME